MRYNEQEWTIGYDISGQNSFGCSAASFAGSNVWNITPKGIVICGKYEETLEEARQLAQEAFAPDAVIAFYSRNNGIEKHLAAVSALFSGVPFCGGGAAPAASGEAELYPSGEDVTMLFIRDDRYSFTHYYRDLHDISEAFISLETSDSRTILSITDGGRTCPAAEWLDALKNKHAFRAESFENVTLTTAEGYNLHLSGDGSSTLNTGSDIPVTGQVHVGLITDAEAQQRINAFLTTEGDLVFGCAGLRSMTTSIETANTCGFLHGEIMTLNGEPHFGNLMMSALRASAK
ncbi:MAG: hypothetical protein E7487_07580 [Ruminococcaceae bacterium]|nr:hypothetical protein [Oscillospiraceae bacterium]